MRLICLLVTIVATALTSWADVQYTVVNVGDIGTGSFAKAISANGNYIGGYYQDSAGQHGYIYNVTAGAYTPIIDPGGAAVVVNGINSLGVATGALASGTWGSTGFFYSDGQMTTLTGDYPSFIGSAINDAGTIVGGAIGEPTFLWYNAAAQWTPSGTTVTLLDSGLPGAAFNTQSSQATAINSHGDVAGSGTPGSGTWVRTSGATTSTDLSNLFSSTSGAVGINDNGEVLTNGTSTTNVSGVYLVNPTHTGASLVGTTFVATGLNDSDSIVGNENLGPAGDGEPDIVHAVIWSQGQLNDLNHLIAQGSGWTLNNATAINNQGYIVGDGTYNGESEAYLLIPGSVPEPSFAGIVILAGFTLVRARRSRS